MTRYDYLLVGGGLASDAAARGIREFDPVGTIGLISAESHSPYKRPYLSKKLWTGKPESSIWCNTAEQGVELLLGRRVVELDPTRQVLTDSQGTSYGYGKLLLATGGSPRSLPRAPEGIIYFRNLDDYHRLRKLCERGGPFIVIGGGFIGSEVAAALAMNGQKVTLIMPGPGIGAKVYPSSLMEFLNNYYRDKGVELLIGERTDNVREEMGHFLVTTTSGRRLEAAGVIAGLGIEPEVSLATSADLSTDNGIVVDEHLRTSNPHIYAAGDVANFVSSALGGRMRVEHEDNAVTMGHIAGRNMAGQNDSYHHLPFFYSDMFELGYEAVGELDSRMEIVEDWREPYHKGVLYYLKDRRVRGVLLWNVWERVEEARTLITAHQEVTHEQLLGKIVG